MVVCSIGDAAITEGEVSEALHMSDLRELPIIWLVQDNEWDISAHASEIRSHDASTLAKAFPQIKAMEIDDADAEAPVDDKHERGEEREDEQIGVSRVDGLARRRLGKS